MNRLTKQAVSGFTLVEVVLALGLSLLTLSVLYSIYVAELKAQLVREEILDAQQRARVVVDLVSRELFMAGFDPAGVNRDANPTNDFQGVGIDSKGLWVRADLNGNGITNDPNESITFSHDVPSRTLRRNTGGGNQPFAEDIELFQATLLDQQGHPTGIPSEVREVELIVTARTAASDPKFFKNEGFRTVTLQSRVTPRNLSP
ncbi:MAG: hypothetical protein R3351_10165 [Nitrospirales bacterium]|nr:hypothetical protein [Nitrospirales bacterium]